VALLPGSPALGAGNVALVTDPPFPGPPFTDQRGFPRTKNGKVDIGAFESQGVVVGSTGNPTPQSTWIVTSDSDDPADSRSLRYAIDNAPSGTTIEFDPSTLGTITLTHGALDITRNLDIEGLGVPALTIDGNKASTVFVVEPFVAVTIAELTIANGGSSTYGGGIFNNQGKVTLSNLRVSNCSAQYGGGIKNAGTMTITNSSIVSNSATQGDGWAGGIQNLGPLSLINCTVANNSAGKYGGGIDNFWTMTLVNCTVANNSAEQGGGIYNGNTVSLTNTTISGNSATGGGGIFNQNGEKVTLANTIVAGNTLTGTSGDGPDAYGSFASQGYNLIGDVAGSSGWLDSDLASVDPLLSPLADNGGPTQTMAPLADSPASGAGSVAFVTNPPFPGPPFTDQRGLPRTHKGKVDIGAFQSLGVDVASTGNPTSQSTWTVTDNSDDPADIGSLRYAINHAPGGTTINFAPSALGTITLIHGELGINTNLEIDGPGAGDLTIDGSNVNRIFTVSSGATAVIEGLTIAHGSAYGGGGINNLGTLTVINVTLSSNSGSYGGGIDNADSARLTLIDCTLDGNSADDRGGGIASNGTLTMTDCIFSNNSAATSGGALYNFGTASLINCTVSRNSVVLVGGGGGISSSGSLTLTNCTLSQNSAANAGGGIVNTGTLILTNCTLAENSARNDSGGGIYNLGTATLTSATVSANLAGSNGGGIDNRPGGEVTLANTIVAGNTAGDGPDALGSFASRGHNLIGLVRGSSGWVQSDLTNVKPLLAGLGDYGGPTQTMALLAGSPALGAGDVALITNPPFLGPPFKDQRGLDRIKNGKVDIGAFESQSLASRLRLTRTLMHTHTVTSNSDDPHDKGSLRYAIDHEPSGTIIDFAPDVNGAITLTHGALKITTDLDIEGPGAGSLRIDGNKASMIFDVARGVKAKIAGLTIAHGSRNEIGGGAVNNGGTLELADCTLSDNFAIQGGAILNEGTLKLTTVTFTNNSAAYYGGAIENRKSGVVNITGAGLSNNSAGNDGGGIDNNGTLTLSSSILAMNSAGVDGGGIVNAGNLTLSDSTLMANAAGYRGGGLCNDPRATVTLTNAKITLNRLTREGGSGPDVYGLYTSQARRLNRRRARQ
jgi:predicted outer membrane repeat protein